MIPSSLLTHTAFHILLGLSLRPRHGYELMQQMTHDSTGSLRVGAGALYTTLKDLSANSYIEDIPFEDNNRRRYYRLTKKGWDRLSQEAVYYANVTELAQERHILGQLGIIY